MTKARDLANASTALSAVSATELGYLDGVTSAVQTQMDAKLASSTAATTYVANSLADAKGDLFVASADNTVTRLPVGSTGETIVADSSTATGLRYQGNFAAGKNKIINGDFGIWQRGTSFTPVSGADNFFADRFVGRGDAPSGTPSVTRQTFTPGAAPVAGYEGQYFLRFTTGGNITMAIGQKIEDVRTLAGQTITVSFWARSSTAKTFTILVRQSFGSGGSADVDQSFNYTTTTSWQRFTQTLTLGSLSGKTIGTNSFVVLQPLSYSGQTGNFDYDIWGVQVEAGSVATAFQTATGTIQGELAACQRYYNRIVPNGVANATIGFGLASSTTNLLLNIALPVPMRVNPTALDSSGVDIRTGAGGSAGTFSNIYIETSQCGNQQLAITATVTSGLTANTGYYVRTTSSAGYVGFSAEL